MFNNEKQKQLGEKLEKGAISISISFLHPQNVIEGSFRVIGIIEGKGMNHPVTRLLRGVLRKGMSVAAMANGWDKNDVQESIESGRNIARLQGFTQDDQ